MANEEKKVWGIHTMDDNLFLNKNVIAIGWKEFGDCSKLEPTREAYKTHFIETYPNGKKGAIAFVTFDGHDSIDKTHSENTTL